MCAPCRRTRNRKTACGTAGNPNREVRFTVRLGATITIPPRPVSASFVAWRSAAPRGRTESSPALLLPPSGSGPRGGYRVRGRCRARRRAEAKQPTPCERSMMKGDIRRRTADASATGTLRGAMASPRDERVPKGTRASANTSGPDFRPGFDPRVKLRVVKDTRTERRKACFFCRTGLQERASFEGTLVAKYDPAV